MTEQTDIEIYRQRYETFRHLDKLRWQMLQIIMAIGSLTAILIKGSEQEIGSWSLLTMGLVLLLTSYVMFRINHGLRMNGKVLADVGKLVGDNAIPLPSKNWKSSSNWIGFTIFFMGLGCLLYSAKHFFIFLCGALNA